MSPGSGSTSRSPLSELTEELFEEGIGFDGSSIRGFQTIDESDMLLFPDADSAQMDPFTAVPTLVLICNVKDPVTGKPYTRDPRYIAQKAEAYVKKSGVADTIYIGPELEFFFFDDDPLRPELQLRLLLHRLRGRASGTPAGRARPTGPTSATSPATSRATSRCRPWTSSRTSAPTWCWPWRAWA